MKNLKNMKNRLKYKSKLNRSGFIIADFLFAFVMVIGVGIFMFALTFSLATVEVAQYILWSTARNYAAGSLSAPQALIDAENKFKNLSEEFPLLTNAGGNSAWFELSSDDLKIGELDTIDPTFNITEEDKRNEFRMPWTGASTTLNLKLFSSLNLPFLGPVATDKSAFTFPIRAFVIRNVSQRECQSFFYDNKRYDLGFKNLEDRKLAPNDFGLTMPPNNSGNGGIENGFGEDNGC